MDAFFRGLSTRGLLVRGLLIFGALASVGAGYRTPNFIVDAPTAEFAKQVGDAAEIYRDELAIEWSGKPLPGNWSSPCPISVKVGTMGAGGATTFNFQNGEVYGWKMEVQGCEQRILDSVLPHEINHTIFACYFRRPLPRWADEGAASLIEHGSERNRLRKIHDQVMGTNRKIPLKALLDMKNYPQDKSQVLTLYAEGHSLADFLIQKSDKPTYLKFLQTAHENGWQTALRPFGYDSIESLESEWDQWVLAGNPDINRPDGSQLADNRRQAPRNPTTIRGQSPDSEKPTSELSPAADKGSPPEAIAVSRPLSRDQLQSPVFVQPLINQSGAARIPHEAPKRPRFNE